MHTINIFLKKYFFIQSQCYFICAKRGNLNLTANHELLWQMEQPDQMKEG